MKGILFKEDMFKATIEGKKTQTRRIIKPQPVDFELIKSISEDYTLLKNRSRYKVDEIVYLKEPYYFSYFLNKVIYKYNTDLIWRGRYINKLFMPEKHARYFIKIKNVRVERLQDISEEDAKAEGVEKGRLVGYGKIGKKSYREGFFLKWIEINGNKSLKENPYLYVYKLLNQGL